MKFLEIDLVFQFLFKKKQKNPKTFLAKTNKKTETPNTSEQDGKKRENCLYVQERQNRRGEGKDEEEGGRDSPVHHSSFNMDADCSKTAGFGGFVQISFFFF